MLQLYVIHMSPCCMRHQKHNQHDLTGCLRGDPGTSHTHTHTHTHKRKRAGHGQIALREGHSCHWQVPRSCHTVERGREVNCSLSIHIQQTIKHEMMSVCQVTTSHRVPAWGCVCRKVLVVTAWAAIKGVTRVKHAVWRLFQRRLGRKLSHGFALHGLRVKQFAQRHSVIVACR